MTVCYPCRRCRGRRRRRSPSHHPIRSPSPTWIRASRTVKTFDNLKPGLQDQGACRLRSYRRARTSRWSVARSGLPHLRTERTSANLLRSDRPAQRPSGWPPPAPTVARRRACLRKVDTLSFCHVTGARSPTAAILPPPGVNAEPGEVTAEMTAVTSPRQGPAISSTPPRRLQRSRQAVPLPVNSSSSNL